MAAHDPLSDRDRALALHDIPRAGVAQCRRALDTIGDGDKAAAAIARARLSGALREAGELSAAFEEGLEGRSQAESTGDPLAQALAWMALGHVFYSVGQLSEAMEWLRRCADVPDLPDALSVRARMSIASMLRAQGRLPEATEAFDELTRDLEGLDPEEAVPVWINAASCWHQVARVGDAREVLAHARAAIDAGARPDLAAWVDAIAAWVEEAAGDLDRALAAGRAALDPERSPSMEVRSSAVRALTRVALRSDGDVRGEVLGALRAAIDAAEKAGARRQAVDLHISASQVCEAGGDLTRAVEHLRSAHGVQELLARDEEKLRHEKEQLRLELARMQVEADTLRAHAGELARANRALAAADGARARLLRMLAHDLNNPLLSVFGAIDLMDPADPVDVEKRRTEVLSAASRMSAVLRGALQPPDSGSWPAVDVAEVAQRCAAAFEGLAARKGQSLLVSHHGDTTLPTDSDALGRILDNLVSNALKFSGASTSVRIEVEGTGSRVDLSVLDEGPGLPEIDAADGLMMGSRLAAKATDGEVSWGIGLHTVYELAAQLGGILALGNRPEGGAAVRVSLPRRSPTA